MKSDRELKDDVIDELEWEPSVIVMGELGGAMISNIICKPFAKVICFQFNYLQDLLNKKQMEVLCLK